MRDFIRDWQGWTRAERVLASVILALAVAGVPTLLAIEGRLTSG